MLGVVKEPPVASEVPPAEAAYQFNVPALPVAVSVTVPGPQREAPEVAVIEGIVLTVASTAVLGEVQPLLVAST